VLSEEAIAFRQRENLDMAFWMGMLAVELLLLVWLS
jgi:hypothetical protein